MKIFVISLPEAAARRAAIARQMAALGLTYSLIDGVRPDPTRPAELGYNERGRLLRYGYGMAPGEIGCFLAHRQAWRAVQAHGKKCVVLEDDVLVPGLNVALLERLALAPYPIVRLAGIFEKRHKFVDDSPFAKYWGDPAGTAGYMLGPREAAQLLRRSARFYMAVDDFMEARHLHGVNTYALLPYPVRQAGVDTQIGHRLRPHLSGFARLRLMLVRIPGDLHEYCRRVLYYVL